MKDLLLICYIQHIFMELSIFTVLLHICNFIFSTFQVLRQLDLLCMCMCVCMLLISVMRLLLISQISFTVISDNFSVGLLII